MEKKIFKKGRICECCKQKKKICLSLGYIQKGALGYPEPWRCQFCYNNCQGYPIKGAKKRS